MKNKHNILTDNHNTPRFTKNFSALKRVKAIDNTCERTLKSVARRYKKFLIIGNYNSGKNTVADAFCEYLHSLNKEPVILPTVISKNIKDVAGTHNWKSFQNITKNGFTVIAPVGYTADSYNMDLLPGLTKLASQFDVIVDVRMLAEGSREVCQVLIRHGNKLRCVYQSSKFAALQCYAAA
jgi:hypothetical protein